MSEYSYFRAEGASRQAIETAEAAKQRVHKRSAWLAEHYGAERFIAWMSDPQFVFPRGAKIPDTFEAQDNSKQNEDFKRSQPIFATPKKGTKDAFLVANLMGLIEKDIKRQRLEYLFQCGDMPQLSLPAGQYSRSFVRAKTWIGGWGTSGGHQSGEGYLYDKMGSCGGSNGAIISTNPLSYLQIEDNWYIRVPNDQTGAPLFTPPDGVPMDYADMLEMDQRAWDIQRGLKPAPSPVQKPPVP